VVLCDISGSMSRYSRMFMHFLHAITNDRDRVHTLVFGTRLTNITRHLRNRDVDIAMNRVAAAIQDWAGGTRIGVCLEEFNRKWSRRLLGQNAVVLLISDGPDRDVGEGLGAEMERLHKSCPHQVVWLNRCCTTRVSAAAVGRARCCRTSTPSCDCTTSKPGRSPANAAKWQPIQ
jgi:hypothetical protein